MVTMRLAAPILVSLVCAVSAAAAPPPDQIVRQIRGALAASGDTAPFDRLPVRHLLQTFYAARGFRPVWIDANGTNRNGRYLIETLRRADDEGLSPADYLTAAIETRLQAQTAARLAELELTLSDALVRYATDVRFGRAAPKAHDAKLFAYERPVGDVGILATAADAADIETHLAGLPPDNPRYLRMKRALRRYREIATSGGWLSLPAGPTLKKGMNGLRVELLRLRLSVSGDLASALIAPSYFEADLELAVRRFERRHGLEADGVVGSRTRAAMNVTAGQRIAQMVLNLERRRWLSRDLGRRYVFVNIADFTMKLVEDRKTVLDMRTVVGRAYRRTPVFTGMISYLELNPYWHVPPRIARNDILPKIRADLAYLARQKITVFSDWRANAKPLDPAHVDWSRIGNRGFPYRLRQSPGTHNALGRVKFMFPNRHNVYLHDTPMRAHFARAGRAFSSGCIRLERPIELATHLLQRQRGWTRDAILTTIDSRKTKVVRLDEKVPVHLSYVTAWVNKDGAVHFRNDVYGRDKRLAQALFGASASAKRDQTVTLGSTGHVAK